jgi:predicted acetyltransferase/8-oxo-dGTP pyrophosphatase MutT (NUDIX family)
MVTQKLVLRELTARDEGAFLRGFECWRDEDPDWYSFVWRPGMSHSDHLSILEAQKDRGQLQPGRVPSSMLYGFVDGEIVGRISIRHELNDSLLGRGGHVGYAVSPHHRGLGYGRQILNEGLAYCRELGLQKILITCGDDNLPSRRLIEGSGGSLENRIEDPANGQSVRRYWIDFSRGAFDPSRIVSKAIAYITRDVGGETQLLVFDHDEEFADAGTQVICGTVESGDSPQTTVIREVAEESGLKDVAFCGEIDNYQFFGDYAKRCLRRHFFHLEAKPNVPDHWSHVVAGNGNDQGLTFHYYWISVKSAKGRLSGRFDDAIDVLLRRLRP